MICQDETFITVHEAGLDQNVPVNSLCYGREREQW